MISEHEVPAPYAQLLDELRFVYLPLNSVAESIVRDIAVARWQILRFDGIVFGLWNLSLADDADIHRFNRQIDQLNIRIARLERRLKFVHANFSTAIDEQTAQESAQPVENANETEEPISLKEYCPETIAFYQRHYPKSKIIIMPPHAPPPKASTPRTA